MSTLSLLTFEERLRREIPGWAWQCLATSNADCIAGTELPPEIEIRASNKGTPVPGTPMYLSGEMLKRWGIDSSARLICNEITPWLAANAQKAGLTWDKLAEI